MSKTPTTSEAPNYWAMTDQQREAHDARFLDKSFWESIARDERVHRLEILLIHTLTGIDITLNMLNSPDSTEQSAQLSSVLASFQKREEKLHQILAEEALTGS